MSLAAGQAEEVHGTTVEAPSLSSKSFVSDTLTIFDVFFGGQIWFTLEEPDCSYDLVVASACLLCLRSAG